MEDYWRLRQDDPTECDACTEAASEAVFIRDIHQRLYNRLQLGRILKGLSDQAAFLQLIARYLGSFGARHDSIPRVLGEREDFGGR